MKKNYFKSLMQAAILLCTPLVIASCDDVFGDVDNPVSSHISIKDAPVSLALHKDSVARATYTRTAIAASGAQIEYSSTKPEIATVDAKTGKITAVGGGDCEIIAKATGLDSRGNKTYQEEEVRFPVKVIDYRARIALKEDATIAVFNSALVDKKPINLSKVLDVFPKSDVTIEYGTLDEDKKFQKFSDGDIALNKVIDAIDGDGNITLEQTYPSFNADNHKESVKVVAHIAAVPKGFETETFEDQQTTAEFTIEVREGIAYIAGYDADDKPIEKSMYYLDNDEEGTKPNYTKMSVALKDITKDAYLDKDWYYLDTDIASFPKNIRVKNNVNIILQENCNFSMLSSDILDESGAKQQSNKLSFFPEKGFTNGTVKFQSITDFNEVNVLDVAITAPAANVKNVNIINGSIGDLDGKGIVNITGGSAVDVYGFETVNINEGASAVDLQSIGAVNIYKGTVKSLTKIETVTITDLAAKTKLSLGSIVANNLIIKGGEVEASQILGFTEPAAPWAFYDEADGKVTMNGGKLTVGKYLGGKNYAVLGDVEVTKGEFTASSADYHAVSGTLTGTFYSKTSSTDWTLVDGTSTTDPYITTVAPKKS